MSRNAKIAGVAALAGIMLAVAVASVREPHEAPFEAVLPVLENGERQDRLARELDRCATLTMPDSGCEVAWAENRRRFFGKDAIVTETEVREPSATRTPGKDAPAADGADTVGSTVP